MTQSETSLVRNGGEESEEVLFQNELRALRSGDQIVIKPNGDRQIIATENRLQEAKKRLDLAQAKARSPIHSVSGVMSLDSIRRWLHGPLRKEGKKPEYIPTEQEVCNPFSPYFNEQLLQQIQLRRIPPEEPGESLRASMYRELVRKRVEIEMAQILQERREYLRYKRQIREADGISSDDESKNAELFSALSSDTDVLQFNLEVKGEEGQPLELYTNEDQPELLWGEQANFYDGTSRTNYRVRMKTRYFIKQGEVYVAEYLPQLRYDGVQQRKIWVPDWQYPHLGEYEERTVNVYTEIPDTIQVVLYCLKVAPSDLTDAIRWQGNLEQTEELHRLLEALE